MKYKITISVLNIGKYFLEYIDFWLDSIHCVREDIQESKTKVLRPPVIMVFTGIDKVIKQEKLKLSADENKHHTEELIRIKIESKKADYKKRFLEIFGCQEKGRHISDTIHFISNTDSPDADFENLRKHISEIAQEMHFFAEILPTSWIELENALAVLRKLKEKETMGYCEKWENINKLAQTISFEEDELRLFLNYQHKIGNVIFFDDESDYIILKPNWLVDCFKCLVCDDNKKRCSQNDLYYLKRKGILSNVLIDKLFSKESSLKFTEYKNHILAVMEKFDIIVKPKSMNSYFLPCMITRTVSLPEIMTKMNVKDSFCTPWLVLEFKFLPIAYSNHILFNYIKEKTVCNEKSSIGDGNPTLYAGKAVVYLDETQSSRLVVCFSRNAISLQIWKFYNVHDDTYPQIIDHLCNTIRELEAKLINQLQYTIKSKCSTGNYLSSTGRIGHTNLNTPEKDYFCEEHSCMHSKEDIRNTWFKQSAVIQTKLNQQKSQSKQKDSIDKEKKETKPKNDEEGAFPKIIREDLIINAPSGEENGPASAIHNPIGPLIQQGDIDTGTHSSIEKGINWSRADPLIRTSESWAQNDSLPIRFNSSSFGVKQKLSESIF